ncbi:MAG: hypothetical protein ABI999_13965 [Acidobacteriota bacterium]
MTAKKKTDPESPFLPKYHPANLFLRSNRGLLLDVVVFVLNLFLTRFLLGRFAYFFRSAFAGDFLSEVVILIFSLGLFVLPPLGSILKRWPFHHRLQLAGKDFDRTDTFFGGCLFNPILYLSLNLIVFCVINAFAQQLVYGDDEPGGGIAGLIIVGGMVLTIVQTVIVYRYFVPPKKDPRLQFLKSPASETLGDICIFLNMIFYQLVWNMLTIGWSGLVSGVSEFFGRILFICALALLVYFPPRVFYLAEDIGRRRTWVTILLANTPMIYRLVVGSHGGWQ